MKRIYQLITVCLFLFSCNQEEKQTLPYYINSDFTPIWKIPSKKVVHKIRPFKLIDQEGKLFTEKNIEHKICIVDFFFTTCPGICPKMTDNMSLLQKQFINDNSVLLLSHSVTPEKDGVSVLKNYAKSKNVNYTKWKLLTGDKNEIYNLGRKFYFVEEDLGENKDTSVFLHTENFILIDKERIIRGIYNGLDPTSIQTLIEDVKTLEVE